MSTATSAHIDITVATTPDAAVSVHSEVRLLKAALLYGDSVTLCSAAVSWYLSLLDLGSVEDPARRFERLLGPLSSDLDAAERKDLTNVWQQYRALETKVNRTPAENVCMEAMRQAVNAVWQTMVVDAEKMARSAGMDELRPALDSGLVTIHPLVVDPGGAFMDEYLQVLISSVTAGTTYPLFDTGAGLGIQAAIHDGLLAPSSVQVRHSRSSMLPGDILRRLPQFETATFDDIMRIRHELEHPLIAFRSAVLSWAGEMQSAPWEKDFQIETHDMYLQHVVPAVQALEQAVEDNAFARTLRRKAVAALTDKGLWAPAALGIAVSSLDAIAHFTQATVIAGAWGVAELRELVRMWAESKQERDAAHQNIERNQLYFVYQAGESLKKKVRMPRRPRK
jgi:hypothetical protein